MQQRYGGLSLGETFHSAITIDQLTSLLRLLEANSNVTLPISANDTDAVTALFEEFARTDNAKVGLRWSCDLSLELE